MRSRIQLLSLFSCLAAGFSLPAVCRPAPAPQAAAWTRHELPGGIVLHVLELPQAPRQTTITLLPLGLIQDDPGLAQAGHLVEHLLVRSTDPIGRGDPGLGVEAETAARAIRLQTAAVPSRWREAQKRHLQWLTARNFEPAGATLERGRIAAEEHRSLGVGLTHRWALVAWNQVIRHGRKHAAVHEDAASVPLELMEALARGKIRPGRGITIAAAGPIAAEDVVSVWREDLAALPWASASPATSDGVLPATSERIREPADREATWDLDAIHYLEWYPVPGKSEADRIRAQVASEILSLRLQSDPELAAAGVLARATTELASGEGRWILLSASLRLERTLKQVKSRFRNALRALAGAGVDPRPGGAPAAPAASSPQGAIPFGGPSTGNFLAGGASADAFLSANEGVRRMLRDLVRLPDFASRRRTMGRHRGGDFLEVRVVQAQVMLARTLDIPLERLDQAFSSLADAPGDAATWEPYLVKPFDASKRSSLLLRPASLPGEGQGR